MPALTNTQLAELRRRIEAEANSPYVKGVLDATFQALEDWFENTARAEISNAINTATQPLGVTLTVAQKQLAAKLWLRDKFLRGG